MAVAVAVAMELGGLTALAATVTETDTGRRAGEETGGGTAEGGGGEEVVCPTAKGEHDHKLGLGLGPRLECEVAEVVSSPVPGRGIESFCRLPLPLPLLLQLPLPLLQLLPF